MITNAIIQARCGSTRFPGKVFADIDGHSLLWHVVNRLKYAKTIDGIIVATTVNPEDDLIEEWCEENRIRLFRGSSEDVLNRYYSASQMFPSDVIVRITADDPFKEPSVIDKVVKELIDSGCDLVTNNFPPSFPEGLDCEAFSSSVLETMEREADDSFEREHVTQFIYRHPERFAIRNVSCERQLSSYRWTIDTKEDYEMVRLIYSHRIKRDGTILLLDEIMKILEKNPEIAGINSKVKRSAMYQ